MRIRLDMVVESLVILELKCCEKIDSAESKKKALCGLCVFAVNWDYRKAAARRWAILHKWSTGFSGSRFSSHPQPGHWLHSVMRSHLLQG